MGTGDWQLVAQALNLLGCVVYYAIAAVLSLPSLLLFYIGARRARGDGDPLSSATFYEGHTLHIRRAPKYNKFRYAVRVAVVDLEAPPAWFKAQAADHLTPGEARKFAGTEGPVRLLTDPMAAGYVQNPISVYYCYARSGDGGAGRLQRCIAEVTNTPWNERVRFVFDPSGQSVQKALHVSPFMDMQNTWHLEAPDPGDTLRLVVRASHPVHGDYFHADLTAARAARPQRLSEEAGLRALLSYGFMPHRVALLIYWQAVKLLAKGVRLHAPPNKAYQQQLIAEPKAGGAAAAAGQEPSSASSAASSGDAHVGGGGGGLCPVKAVWGAARHSHPRNGADGRHFAWQEAPRWPWRDS